VIFTPRTYALPYFHRGKVGLPQSLFTIIWVHISGLAHHFVERWRLIIFFPLCPNCLIGIFISFVFTSLLWFVGDNFGGSFGAFVLVGSHQFKVLKKVHLPSIPTRKNIQSFPFSEPSKNASPTNSHYPAPSILCFNKRCRPAHCCRLSILGRRIHLEGT
jgi:hypothetical protein